MTTTKLEMSWDVGDEGIVCALNAGTAMIEVDTLTIDEEEVMAAFAEDFMDAVKHDEPGRLEPWEAFSNAFGRLSSDIGTAIRSLYAQRTAFRHRLLNQGVPTNGN